MIKQENLLNLFDMGKRKKIAWWSAGGTSAVATKIALEMYDNVEIFYIHIGSAHPDNKRFMNECEQWYGHKIHTVTNSKGFRDQFDVIHKTRYVNGPYGARCSKELKKTVREEMQLDNWENQIFGFEFSKKEINRAIRFMEQHPETNPLFPLIEKKVSGEEAHGILMGAGIKLPKMYELGFENNNCIGCVKGGKGYWNKIREEFPMVFNRMAVLEREIGHTCLKDDESNPIYLDTLNPGEGVLNPIVPSCGLFCQLEFEHIMDKRVDKIMNGEMSIKDVA